MIHSFIWNSMPSLIKSFNASLNSKRLWCIVIRIMSILQYLLLVVVLRCDVFLPTISSTRTNLHFRFLVYQHRIYKRIRPLPRATRRRTMSIIGYEVPAGEQSRQLSAINNHQCLLDVSITFFVSRLTNQQRHCIPQRVQFHIV